MVGIENYTNTPIGLALGMSSQGEVDALNKALNTTSGATAGAPRNPLQVESLESSLKVLTHTEQHAKLWKKIDKLPAYSTVEEYNRLESVGNDFNGGFIGEGQLPAPEDSVYRRMHSFVKFMGVTKEISHPMTLVTTAHGSAETQETQNGILWLIKKLEQALFFGDSSLAPNGQEGVQFDGLNKQIKNAIDLKGQPLTDTVLNKGADIVVQNYGIATDIYLPYPVLSRFSETYFPKERVISPSQDGYQAGLVVNKFNTIAGTVDFNPDVFLQKTKELPTAPTGGNLSPTAPATVTVETDSTKPGDWAKGITGNADGVYKYWVSAVNRYGESVPTNASSDLTLSGESLKQGVKVTITNASSVAVAPEYFNVYRSEKDGTKGYLIASIPAKSTINSGTTDWNDANEVMANTYTAFFGEFNRDVLSFKQLAPMMKMDLAVTAPVKRFMILLYGTPQVYNPNKLIKFVNIKGE